MEISVNTQDIDNLESFSDFEFFKFFWEKYQEPTNVRFEKHRVRLTSAFNTERPKLTKDDIYTMEKFVNTLDDSFFPKFIWNEDGTHELYMTGHKDLKLADVRDPLLMATSFTGVKWKGKEEDLVKIRKKYQKK